MHSMWSPFFYIEFPLLRTYRRPSLYMRLEVCKFFEWWRHPGSTCTSCTYLLFRWRSIRNVRDRPGACLDGFGVLVASCWLSGNAFWLHFGSLGAPWGPRLFSNLLVGLRCILWQANMAATWVQNGAQIAQTSVPKWMRKIDASWMGIWSDFFRFWDPFWPQNGAKLGIGNA